MLYSLMEGARAAFSDPLARTSAWGLEALDGAGSMWFPPEARRMAQAWMELTHRLNKEYERPAWRVDAHESVVLAKPFCELRRFAREGLAQGAPRVLIVAPMSGHYATLLRDTVKAYVQDFEVFVTDWLNPRDIPIEAGEFDLRDYVDHVMEFSGLLSEKGARPIHMVSVCQPTVPTLCAAAYLAEDGRGEEVASLVMVGGPIDARLSPTAPDNFATSHSIEWFESRLISQVPWTRKGAGRSVYPGFLQHMGFVAMNPSRHKSSHREFFESLVRGDDEKAAKHREFYDEYNAVMDLPAPYYLQTIKKVFQDFDLARGRMELRGRLVKPELIAKSALLTVEGELDDISGAGQTHCAQGLCSGIAAKDREQFTAPGVGHYGVFSGSRFRREVYPIMRDFIFAHDKGAAKAKRSGKPAA